jgi:prepilin-type N-terminal cleavage/methylation domain-containing protein/prepilin-type processing-associated H-X9-DG protein
VDSATEYNAARSAEPIPLPQATELAGGTNSGLLLESAVREIGPADFRIVRISGPCQNPVMGQGKNWCFMKTGHDESDGAVSRSRGFTLIELAAVCAIFAVLAMLVLPALAKGDAGSREAICLNNHRQLARACVLYSQDFENRLPNNYTIPATQTAISSGTFDNWANNVMTWSATLSLDDRSNTNVAWAQMGPLSPYLQTNISVFKCPSDNYLSPQQRFKGWSARLRSISMNGLFGRSDNFASSTTGRAWFDSSYQQFLRTSDVLNPSMTWLTIDEQADSINEGFFIVSATATQWGDIPASYHNGACSFSFADGHSEMHKWLSSTSRYPVKFAFSTRPFDAAGRKDFQWYKDRLQLILFR